MDAETHPFVAWALDERLNDEEAYCAERLVEQGLPHDYNIERRIALQKRRRLNPAHRVHLKKEDVFQALDQLLKRLSISLDGFQDRPLRDLSGLRFFPLITSFSTSGSELTDISILASLSKLERLSLMDKELEDARPIAACASLRHLSAYLRRHWVRVDGWEKLPLETLLFHGNLLVLETIPRFEHLRDAKFENTTNLPLRDATRLPEMPNLEVLTLEGIERLDGIGKWTRLRNLTLGGPIHDLTPLIALKNLTHLTLGTICHKPKRCDLAPLCQLPALHSLTIVADEPMDVFALTDAPQLREVQASYCEVNERDAETLQSMLRSWEELFCLPKPRPLPPLKLFAMEHKKLLKTRSGTTKFGEGADGWHGDKDMRLSENKCFTRLVEQAVNKLMPDQKWGEIHVPGSDARTFMMSLHGLRAGARTDEVVAIIRKLMARWRHPYTVWLSVYNQYDDPWADDTMSEEERDRLEHEDYKQRVEEQKRLRERAHRMRQLREEGAKIDPEEFAEEDIPVPPEDDEGGGGLFWDSELAYFIYIHPEAIYVSDHNQAAVEDALGVKAQWLD